jgi:hypothetical protein
MRLAVITTKGTRQSLLACYTAIATQVDDVFIVHNGMTTEGVSQMREAGAIVMPYLYDWDRFNLSRAWTQGIRSAQAVARGRGFKDWFTAVLNDDAIVPDGWMDAVSQRMMIDGAAAGSSGCHYPGGSLRLSTPIMHVDTMRGWAFILRGPVGLMPDPRFVWWYGDNDLACQAAKAGGLVRIPGYEVPNLQENQSMVQDAWLMEQAGEDRQRFEAKWGFLPW